MNAIRFVLLLLLVLSPAADLVAQRGCPFLRAKSVPATWQNGPGVSCDGGINMDINGLQIRGVDRTCPLFVIITPTHDVTESSSTPTRVVQRGLVQEIVIEFKCVDTYFLIFVTGSACERTGTINAGGLQLLDTVACADVQMESGA